MCLLKAFSSHHSFQEFTRTTSIPVYSCKEKGEPKGKTSVQERHQISFDVSTREWDDFPGQVEDAISFLERWGPELTSFKAKFQPEELILDFAIYSPFNTKIINQHDYLPAKLISLAGGIGMSIGMSIYSIEAFDD